MAKTFKDTIYGDLTGQDYIGSINVSYNDLSSLEGAPDSVTGNFLCPSCKLKSLKYAPKKVGGNFHCHINELKSLKYAPETVGGDFFCSNNNITSLDDFYTVIDGKFDADGNPNKDLGVEYKLRQENPDMTHTEVRGLMYGKTGDEKYLPDDAVDIFLF